MPLSPNTFVNVLKEITFCKIFYTKEKWCRKFLVLLTFLQSGNKVSGLSFRTLFQPLLVMGTSILI